MNRDLADLRRNYQRATLSEQAAPADPMVLFNQWFDEAVRAEEPEPNAMALATVGTEGEPRARIVLLKEIKAGGPVFYTNYESDKGRELERDPRAALTFWWASCERQVRFEGVMARLLPAESEAYFRSRPRDSQLGASASPQSRVLESREALDAIAAEVARRFQDREIPRPEHWGGYRLGPKRIEFWQGRESRLHDRLCYVQEGEHGWRLLRLAP